MSPAPGLVSEREADLLVTGARIGTSCVLTYLAFLDGFRGSSSELANFMGLGLSNASTHVRNLRNLGLVKIAEWGPQKQPIYGLADGEPDAPRPLKADSLMARKVAAIVGNYERRQVEIEARTRRFSEGISKRTKHGIEQTAGAVRVHRMRG